ncbi:MAG: MmgE/PrpD family protein [Dehalococcoidia bacterium]
MNITETVAGFVAETRLDIVPEEGIRQAKRAILDTLGVSLAGSEDESVRTLTEVALERGGKPTAGVIGTGIRTDCLTAALINGTMAHALDYDDVNDSMMGHPSAPLMPAVMALGEEVGASGSRVLEAFLAGFEVECKLGLAVGRSHYVKGWHATSTLGTMGAAAAAAKLLELDAYRTQMALGIAASMAGGIRQNFGTMTKPLHVGQASRNGVLAAILAQKGFTASPHVLDAPLDFCQLFSTDDFDVGKLDGTLGSPWEIISSGITVKKYPCCNNVHRTLDATLEIVDRHRPSPGEVAGVKVITPPGEDLALIYSRATTGLEGKFCMQYCVAAALLDGKVDPATFDDEQVARRGVQSLSSKVSLVADPEQAQVVVESRGHVEVRVSMKDGQEYVERVSTARGSAENPLSWSELVDKYTSCARALLSSEQVERSIKLIESLEELPNVKELMGTVSLVVPQREMSST